MNIKRLLTLFPIFILGSFITVLSLTHADTINLKNNKVLKGSITKEEKGGIWLDLSTGTEVFIPHTQIKSINKTPVEEIESRKKEDAELNESQRKKGLIEHNGKWVTEEEKQQGIVEEDVRKKGLDEKYLSEVRHAQQAKGRLNTRISVDNAVQGGRVVAGMTKEQVIKSVGNPDQQSGEMWLYGYRKEKETGFATTGRNKFGQEVGFPVTSWYFHREISIHFSSGIVDDVDYTVEDIPLQG